MTTTRDTHTRLSAEWLRALREETMQHLAEYGDVLACGDEDKLRLLDEIDCLHEELAELRRKT